MVFIQLKIETIKKGKHMLGQIDWLNDFRKNDLLIIETTDIGIVVAYVKAIDLIDNCLLVSLTNPNISEILKIDFRKIKNAKSLNLEKLLKELK